MQAALGQKNAKPENIAESIRAKMLLSKARLKAQDDSQLAELRQQLHDRIGDRAYLILEAHDRLLEEWAAIMPMARDLGMENAAEYARDFGPAFVKLNQRQAELKPIADQLKSLPADQQSAYIRQHRTELEKYDRLNSLEGATAVDAREIMQAPYLSPEQKRKLVSETYQRKREAAVSK